MLKSLHPISNHVTCGDETPSSESTTADVSIGLPRDYPAVSMKSFPDKIIRLEYAVRGRIACKADEIASSRCRDKPFGKILQCNIGNPQALGLQPLTYLREILSMVSCPLLLKKADDELKAFFQADTIRRARTYAAALGGTGAYTHSQGAPKLREEVALFFERRDGVKPNIDRIMLTNGASEGINTLLTSLIDGPQDAVLLPLPQYPLYAASVTKLGGTAVYYQLDESANWSLDEDVLGEAYDKALLSGLDVKILVVISPGNPCPTFLERDQIYRILKFARNRNLLVIADEVYQDNVYGTRDFTSFRRVLCEEKLTTQLASVHSGSKGFYGECGLRAGVCQVENVSDEAFEVLYKLRSVDLCSNTLGQVVMTSILNPPVPGDESFNIYQQEKTTILTELATKAKVTCDFFNTLTGVTCRPIEAGMYAFPCISFPAKAEEFAAKRNTSVELLYCLELLEATGIATTAGEGFGQKAGTHHIRMTILPQMEDLKNGLEAYRVFHESFFRRFA